MRNKQVDILSETAGIRHIAAKRKETNKKRFKKFTY